MYENRFSIMKDGYLGKNKLGNNKISGEITVEGLISCIKNNPQKNRIKSLRKLDKDEEVYSETKGQLPCIKVHGRFDKIGDSDHLIDFTGLFYYDIDYNISKEEIIKNHGNIIYMLGKSCGGKGKFIVCKIKNQELLTKENFDDAHDFIKHKYFPELNTDNNAKGIVRNFVITSDENLSVNDSCEELEIQFQELKSKRERNKKPEACLSNEDKENEFSSDEMMVSVYKQNTKACYTLKPSLLDIKSFYDEIVWKTPVEVNSPRYEVKPVEVVKLFIHKMPDTEDHEKHKYFPGIVFALRDLNPSFDFIKVLSFMNWVNQNFTYDSPMEWKEFYRLIECAFNNFDSSLVKRTVQRVHFHKDCGYSKADKISIANKENAKLKVKKTQFRIKTAIEYLLFKGKKLDEVTIKEIVEQSEPKLHRSTVSKYLEAVKNQIRSAAMPYNQMKKEMNTEHRGDKAASAKKPNETEDLKIVPFTLTATHFILFSCPVPSASIAANRMLYAALCLHLFFASFETCFFGYSFL